MPNSNKYLKNLIAFFILPMLVAFSLQLKTFFLPECGSFDYNDDANQTFPNLAVARSIMKSGELPLINYFINFGAPIAGDATTYPFALHALTYWFMSDYHAMMVNRFIITVFTIVVLTVFFRRYMSSYPASVCALLAFLTPGFLHNLDHHHYQSTLLYFRPPLKISFWPDVGVMLKF